MAYVLILLLSAYGSDGGNALATARFDTQAACEAAGKEAQEMAMAGRYSKSISFRCAPTK